MRAIVDWSWELLGPDERTALARLSVFAGGATPEAAEYVCTTGQGGDEVIDVVASLVDKSLVVAREDEAGDVRYRLLETVRAYAAERLGESGELAVVRDAHAQCFLALAEHADPRLRGPEQMKWMTRLTLERDNISAAMKHAVVTQDAESALRFFQGMTWFWMMRNHESDAAQWSAEVGEMVESTGYQVPEALSEALQLCDGTRQMTAALRDRPGEADAIAQTVMEVVPPESLRAKHPLLVMARPIAGILASRAVPDAGARTELAVLAEHPDPWVRAARYAYLGLLELHHANPDEAEENLRVGYAAYADVGDRLGLMFTLIMLTEFSLARGRFAEAVRRAEEAYGYASEGLSGDSGSILLVKVGLARALAGEVEVGRRLMEQGAATAEHLGEYHEAAAGYSELAALALRTGDRVEARRRLAYAQELIDAKTGHAREAGLAYSMILARRGYLAALEGELDAARELLHQAVDLVRDGPLLSFMAGLDEVVRGLAALASLQGDQMRAAELLGSAHAVVGLQNKASYSDAATRAAAIAALGQEAFDAAYERGQRLQKADLLELEP